MIYVQAMKVSSTLTDEHVACLQVVICKTNSGIIKQRLRGGKKGVLDELTELRKVTVEVIEREGVKVKEKFRAMKVETWKKEHPGQDPITAGFPVRMLKIQGVQCQCVLYRHLPEGHYDLEIESSVETAMKEIVDSGEMTLREGQQKAKYAEAQMALTQSIRKKDDKFEILDTHSRAPIGSHGKDPTAEASVEQNADSESQESDAPEGEDDYEMEDYGEKEAHSDSLLNSILGLVEISPKKLAGPQSRLTAITPKAKKKDGKQSEPCAKRAKKQSEPEGSSEHGSARGQSGGGVPSKKRGRNSIGSVELSVEGAMNAEGITNMESQLAALTRSFTDMDGFQSLLSTPIAVRDFESACSKTNSTAKALYIKLVQTDNKLSKRVNVPAEVASKLKELRSKVKNIQDLVFMFPIFACHPSVLCQCRKLKLKMKCFHCGMQRKQNNEHAGPHEAGRGHHRH